MSAKIEKSLTSFSKAKMPNVKKEAFFAAKFNSLMLKALLKSKYSLIVLQTAFFRRQFTDLLVIPVVFFYTLAIEDYKFTEWNPYDLFEKNNDSAGFCLGWY